ncbi:ABC transporter ATP-binding protein [Chloroflexia bacterium SDU3-3]|nr:ABC transporter ATP-binding protein [Chloroflexia bacterium SDU3-3]
MAPLLEVKDLHVEFKRPGGVVHAVNGVNFTVESGQSLGIVGESGSGKSVTMLSLLGLIGQNGRVVGGQALLNGEDLTKMSPSELRDMRGRDIGVIFQDPMTSLNPIMRIGQQIMESMLVRNTCSPAEAKRRAIELLGRVGIPQPEKRLMDYPFQFSGGMRQRVMIAVALALNPQLLVADEPTTALDVTVQAQVLDLLHELRREIGMGMIIITHDFGVATNYCDRIAVMYAGSIAEMTTVEKLVNNTSHPYTLGLLNSTMEIGHGRQSIEPIPGTPPSAMVVHKACPFAPRCRFSTDRCRTEKPLLRTIENDHMVACHHAEEVASHVQHA